MKKFIKGICCGFTAAVLMSVSAFAAEIAVPSVEVDKELKTAEVEVSVTNPEAEQYVTVLIIKNTSSLASVSENDIAYVDQEKTDNGKVKFRLGVDTEKYGEKFTVYVGGTGVAVPASADFDFSEANNPGDTDGDKKVNIKDYNAVIDAFGSVKGAKNYNSAADFNNDDKVNILDYGVVIDNFGKVY